MAGVSRKTIFSLVLITGIFLMAEAPKENIEYAYFAGGCFWCMEEAFESLDGVIDAVSGYTGSDYPNPSYEDVSYKDTGHFEAVKIIYDSEKIDYAELLSHFWINVDPTQADGQFCDKGNQYLSAVFYANPKEKALAKQSALEYQSRINSASVKGPVKFVTQLLALGKFYEAEDYHQNYYNKNPVRYKTYKYLCGRSQRLKDLWGK